MKKTSTACLAILFLLGVYTTVSAQQNRLVGKFNREINNPGCYFYFTNGGLVFYDDAIDGTWMNIDGRDVKLNLIKQRTPRGKMHKGSRFVEQYAAGDITVNVIKVITKLSSTSKFSATITVRKGNRTQVVRATGICGD